VFGNGFAGVIPVEFQQQHLYNAEN